jgi:LysM domain
MLLAFSPALAGQQTYVVRAGDTMSSIAADHLPGEDSIYRRGGRLKLLIRANPKVRPVSRVHIGMTLILPALNEIDLRVPASDGAPTAEVQTAASAPSPAHVSVPVAAAPPPSPVALSEAHVSQPPALGVDLSGSSLDIRSRDVASGARANFASDFVPTVGVTLNQAWSDRWQTYGKFNYRETQILAPASGATIEQPKSQKGFALGFRTQGSSITLGGEVGIKQSLFPRATAASTFTFDRLNIPYVGIRLNVEPIVFNQQRIGLEGSYNYLGVSQTGPQSARSGKELGLAAYWSYEFKSRKAYRLGAFYSKTEQNTNLVDHQKQELGLGFNLMWPLGD